MTGVEGGIRLTLHLVGDRVGNAAITSTRPVGACSALEGRPVEEALRLLPNMFSICGTAQGHAGLEAAEAAMGWVASALHQDARQLLLLAETASEHAWRALMDWPPLIDGTPDVPALATLKKPLARISGHLYPDGDWNRLGGGRLDPDRDGIQASLDELTNAVQVSVLGIDWNEVADVDSLSAWAGKGATPPARLVAHLLDLNLAGFGASDVDPMPDLDPVDLDQHLDEDAERDFVASPRWHGAVFQTGPLARQWSVPLVIDVRDRFGPGVLSLVVSRLVELSSVIGEMGAISVRLGQDEGADAATGSSGGSGVGMAAVEAARGRLVHRVAVEDGRVTRYQILAPTEWNFHGDGPLTRGLEGASAENVEARARMLVSALDPCVACEIDVVGRADA